MTTMSASPQSPPTDPAAPHMIVCGDDALAHRLAAELREVYRARVTVLVPVTAPVWEPARTQAAGPRRASALLGRVTAAIGRAPVPRQGKRAVLRRRVSGSWRRLGSPMTC